MFGVVLTTKETLIEVSFEQVPEITTL